MKNEKFYFWKNRLVGSIPVTTQEYPHDVFQVTKLIDLDIITDKEFYMRHKHVLALVGKVDPYYVGLFIGNRYYKDIWYSPKQAARLGHLMNLKAFYYDEKCALTLFYGDESVGIVYLLLTTQHFESIRNLLESAAVQDESDIDVTTPIQRKTSGSMDHV